MFEKMFIEIAKFDELICKVKCSSSEYKVMRPIFDMAIKNLQDTYGIDYYDECEQRGYGCQTVLDNKEAI